MAQQENDGILANYVESRGDNPRCGLIDFSRKAILMIVYKITNLDNGKIYIGQTKFTVEKRFKEHARQDSYLGHSIRLHGEDRFRREVLEICETREQAYELEIYYIAKFDCMAPKGYNLTKGGLSHPQFESQNGDDWVIVYEDSFEKLGKTAPLNAWKVFAALAASQEFEKGIKTTKRAVSEKMEMSYDNVIRGFNWLKENGYVKERKVNGQTEFLLNPNVTTCGRNKSKKAALWNSI